MSDVYQQKVIVPKEMFNEPLIDEYLKKKNTFNLPYCYKTFLDYAWEKGKVLVVFQNEEPRTIYLTAPEGEMKEATNWVLEKNKDLNLFVKEFGYNADDFVRARMTARLIPYKFLKKMTFTKHIIGDMVDGVQRCLICGEVINSHIGLAWPSGQAPPKPYQSGSYYVSDTTNPKITVGEDYMQGYIDDGHKIQNCK